MDQNTTDTKFNYVIILLLMVLFWGINQCLPFVMDDALYAHIYPAVSHCKSNPHGLDVDETINSVYDVLISQYHHYFNNNGRSIVHTVVQLFCGLLGKNCYNVFAAFLFGVFAIVLCKTCYREKSIGVNACVPLLFVFLFCPEPTCYYDGIAYGVNYLWSETFCLLFVIYFLKKYNTSYLTLLLLALLSFVAGWSHEGFVIGICGGLFDYFIMNYKKMNKMQWTMLICFGIGTALLVFSPGNFARADRLNETNSIENLNPFQLRLKFFEFIRSTYFLLAILMFWLIKDKNHFFSFVKKNRFWFSSMGMSFLFLMAVGVLNKRAVVGFEFFSSILLCKAFLEIKYVQQHCNCASICSTLIVFISGIIILYYQFQTGNQYRSMELQVSTSKYSSCFVKVPDVNPNYFIKRFVCQYKFEEPWEPWEHQVLAWRYKKNKVVVAEGDWHTVNGHNCFKQLGYNLYTTNKLPENVNLRLHLGNYQAFDMMSFIKKMASYLRPSSQNEILITLPVEKKEVEGKCYYSIALYPNSSREITAIDLEK